jgi:DNA-binding NarL/FixJ family response regulator
LDIKLPDMEGRKVYPLIMEARPDMKVLVCSGYSIHGPAQDILDAGAEGFIQKPFHIAELAEN